MRTRAGWFGGVTRKPPPSTRARAACRGPWTRRTTVAITLTRDFKETIQARAVRDPAFREELLKEGVASLLSGDVETGKAVLRDYINATIGFEEPGSLTDKSPKSLMRMFGPKGNPQARNLFEIIGYLQKREGVRFEVRAVR